MLESRERPKSPTESAPACQPLGERNRRGRHSARRPRKVGLLLTLSLALFVLPTRTARPQDEVRNFKQPILMVETGGHHAPVRSLIWQNGPAPALLSGGEDKVVKVWDFQTGPRLARSIRPPVWRGAAGRIHALAITKPDALGQSYLAVGGYGVESNRGDLTIFRFPGVARGQDGDGRIPTGDVAARLLGPSDKMPQQIGHTDTVLCLAFDPTGRVLASGSIDKKVILWDVPAFTSRAVLRAHTGDIRALAFSPDGQRLATAGSDGSIRLWDVATGNPVGQPPPVNQVRAVAINTLAYSPDGQSIVLGRENGEIYRRDARSLAPVDKLATLATQGPVEFLTYSPDGQRLAVSIISKSADLVDPKTITCDVELRAMPAGNVIRTWTVPGLVYALAFSPAGDRLAYAGGPVQSIFIQELANLELRPKRLEGQGSTPFDLGFTGDSKKIVFHRERFDPANPPENYEAFDLEHRRFLILPRSQLQRAINSFNGWTVRGVLNLRLEAVHQDGRTWLRDLSAATERNRWSFTIIPPGPGHARPTVAVGCEAGVVVYDLETGRRTRFFAGHGSAVVSLAPSPDGRFIASSSLDQTIMLYPLAGCDVRPGFGATFQQRADGAWMVARVEPRGFAAGMGLRSGDVIVRAQTSALDQTSATTYTAQSMAQLVRVVDDLRPAIDTVAIWVRRRAQVPEFGALELALPPVQSTKRNNPVLTLMPGLDKEWVIWTPQGFYDTSIEGDARFLGWHINADFRLARPTDFVSIGTYAMRMFQPKVLDRLWQTADLDQAVAQAALPAGTPPPERLAYDERPPRVIFTPVEGGVRLPDPGLVLAVNVPNPSLGVSIKAEGTSKITSRRIVVDERPLELPRLVESKTGITDTLQVDLVPRRRTRLEVEAVNESGKKRTEILDLLYNPPQNVKPPQARPRQLVLAIGNDQAKKPDRLPAISFAGVDAVDLANFVTKHLVSRDGTEMLNNPADQIIMVGQGASVKSIAQALGWLEKRLEAGQLQKGDVVAVIVGSHVLDGDKSAIIVGSDTDPECKPPDPSIRTKDLSDLLGRLTDYGCRVVLFLDCVHDVSEKGFASDVKSWVRELKGERRVITFVASKEGPSAVDARAGHGFFALGVTGAFQEVVAAEKGRDEPYTLEEFGIAVSRMVSNLSSRQQQAFCYIPSGISPQSIFARP
jgi:WD40 repeat protein